MLRITYGTHTTTFPNSWEDCGEVAWQLLRDLARMPAGEGKLTAMRRLSGLGKRSFRRLTDEDIISLDALTPWLSIATPIREPLRKVMRHKGHTYYWPDLDFIDGQALAFQYADEYFEQVMGDDPATAIEATRHLVATLARPMEGLGRKPVTSLVEIEARAEAFKDLSPEWSAQAIMYWAGVKMAIAETYGEYLFPKSDGGAQSSAPTFGWATWFREIAAEGVFGDLAAVHRADMHDVCQHLSTREGRRRDERRAHEESMARTKNK